MTLDEAIEHCKEKALGKSECANEHKQLAEWLERLQKWEYGYDKLMNNLSNDLQECNKNMLFYQDSMQRKLVLSQLKDYVDGKAIIS